MTQGNPTDGFINESRFSVNGDASRGNPREQDNSKENFLRGGSPSACSSTPLLQYYHQISVPAAGASNSAGAAPRQRRLRRSCDFCTKRKRKCDGDGVNPCSLCVAKNQAVCRYSERLPTGPKPQVSSPATNSIGMNNINSIIPASGGNLRVLRANEGGCNPREYFGAGERRLLLGGSETETEKQQHQALDSVAEGRGVDQSLAVRGGAGGPSCACLLPLKRARLSPSPATGLVGHEENVYIGDFFRVLGFLSLTHESDIRKAMIANMFGKLQHQGGDDHSGGSIVPSTKPADVEAASCVLWCTVALGYLVEGRPKKLVVGYTNLAREALSGCFDGGSVGTARAFISMAILQNFLGDEIKYRKHVDFAKSIIAALPPGAVPEELKETILHMRVSDMCWLEPGRFGEDAWEMKKECATLRRECSQLPDELEEKLEKPNIFRKTDLCRWIIQLDARMGHGFHKDMFDVGLYDDISNRYTLTNRNRPAPDVVANDSPQTSILGVGDGGMTTVVPPPPGESSRKFAANAMKDFNALKSLTENSEICDSVGELTVRSIMAYASRVGGRGEDCFENLQRCSEVIIEHPGLCRFTTWKHLTHCTLKVLAGEGCRDKYSKLRDVYNSMMDEPGMRKAPPFEEFRSVRDICDGFFCQSICSKKLRDFPTPSSENMIQELSPVEDVILGPGISVTPSPPSSLENASLLSSETPQDGQEQLQPAVPVAHLPPLQGLTSSLSGGGVAAAGTGLHVPGEDGGTNWVGWNTTVIEGGGVNAGSSSDGYSGNRSSSKSSSGDVRSGAAVAFIGNQNGSGNEYSDFSGGMSGFREEQTMPLELMTTTTVDGLEDLDSVILMDAVDAILGDADLEEMLASDNSRRVNQSWSEMEFQKGSKG